MICEYHISSLFVTPSYCTGPNNSIPTYVNGRSKEANIAAGRNAMEYLELLIRSYSDQLLAAILIHNILVVMKDPMIIDA